MIEPWVVWASFVLAIFAVLCYQEWSLQKETNEIFARMSRTTRCVGDLIDELRTTDARQRKQIARLQRQYDRERRKRLVRSYKLAQEKQPHRTDPVTGMLAAGDITRWWATQGLRHSVVVEEYRQRIKLCRESLPYPLPG